MKLRVRVYGLTYGSAQLQAAPAVQFLIALCYITMSLANYLAQNYLTADPPPEKKPKKRKRKGGAQSGLVIADDDDSSWKTQPAIGEETDRPLTSNSLPTGVRPSKSNLR